MTTAWDPPEDDEEECADPIGFAIDTTNAEVIEAHELAARLPLGPVELRLRAMAHRLSLANKHLRALLRLRGRGPEH